MNIVILDLEWNSGYSRKKQGFINEIIEFGAVKLNEDMDIIGQFSIFVRPEITGRLNRTVKALTSLTNEDLKNGASFTYAVNKFAKFAQDCVIMTWSTSDLNSLEINFEYYSGSMRIPFLKKYADLQAYCQDRMGLSGKNQIALQAAAELLGIDTEGLPLHRAVGDSILSAMCLKKLYDPAEFVRFVKNADDEFYARLNFRSVYITNPESPLIDKKEMRFDCETCGIECTRKSEWKSKGKYISAHFECPQCGAEFTGKLRFKLLYDGLKVSRFRVPIEAECTEKQDDNQSSEDQP